MRHRLSLPAGLTLALLLAAVAAVPVAASSFVTVPRVQTTSLPPACRIADTTAQFTGYADWSRTLVDWTLRVPTTYAPKDLVPISRAGISGGGSIRSFVIPDLAAMTRAARAAGAPIAVESAYRSYATQISTFNSWVSALGYPAALIGSARPGHSEHQLGLAIDFKTPGGAAPWSFGGYDWATSKAGAWMMKNAWKYGFVLSYPKGKISQVCYGYEPWHYRYFGRATAAAIHGSGQAPRVWLWQQDHGGSAAVLTRTGGPGSVTVRP